MVVQEEAVEWERRIATLLARLAYWQSLAASYQPTDIFPGQTLLITHYHPQHYQQQPPTQGPSLEASAELLARGGPGGAWERIIYLVQPLAGVHVLQPAGGTPTSAARQLQAALLEAVRLKEAADQALDLGLGSSQLPLALLSPRPAASSLLAGEVDASQLLLSALSEADTIGVVLPLNRLCPERRYILRCTSMGAVRLGGGTPRQLTPAGPPLSRLPLWVLHDETGSIMAAHKELAAALPLPCYGLAMGGDTADCGSVQELAQHYCAALKEVQPTGPYLLLGPSIAGAALAHAMACHLRAGGTHVGLLLLDGCVGRPAIPLHDATWYALFYLLREIGTLQGSMGEFIDRIRWMPFSLACIE